MSPIGIPTLVGGPSGVALTLIIPDVPWAIWSYPARVGWFWPKPLIDAKTRDVGDDPQVLPHRFARELSASRLDGGKDLPVGFQRAGRPSRFAERLDAALLDHVGHRVDHVHEDFVAGCERDRVMKGGITLDAETTVGDLGLHHIHRRFHGFEVMVAPSAGGELRQLRLEGLARFEHVGQTAPALEQLPERLTKATRAPEKNALAMADVDEAQRLEHDKRLAHRGAAHLQLSGQVSLGRELVPRLHARLAHELAEPLADVLVKAAAFEGAKRCSGHGRDAAESIRRTGPVVQPLTTCPA